MGFDLTPKTVFDYSPKGGVSGDLDKNFVSSNDEIFVLVDLELGKTWRVSTSRQIISKNDGTELFYKTGLSDSAIERSFQMLQQSPTLESFQINFTLPELNISKLIAEGEVITGARCEISLWLRGTKWEDRKIVTIGQVKEPTFGGPDESVSFTVEASVFSDNGRVVPPHHVVSQEAFALEAPENSVGRLYPFVWGRPGQMEKAGGVKVYASVGFPVLPTSTRIIVGDGWIGAQTILIVDDDTGQAQITGSVSPGIDDLGNRYSFVSISATPGLSTYFDKDKKYWTSFSTAGETEGGYVSRQLKTPVLAKQDITPEGAGEAVITLLNRSTLFVNQASFENIRTKMNDYDISFYVDNDISSWEFMKDKIFPILPMTLRRGSNGVEADWWNFTPQESEHRWKINTELSIIERISSVQYENPSTLANSIRVKYAFSPRSNNYYGSVLVTGNEQEGLAYSNAISNVENVSEGFNSVIVTQEAIRSRKQYGDISFTVETDVVFRKATAFKIAKWLSLYHSLPSRVITYTVPKRYIKAKPGELVSITDEDLCMFNVQGYVDNVVFSGAQVAMTVRVFDSQQVSPIVLG